MWYIGKYDTNKCNYKLCEKCKKCGLVHIGWICVLNKYKKNSIIIVNKYKKYFNKIMEID